MGYDNNNKGSEKKCRRRRINWSRCLLWGGGTPFFSAARGNQIHALFKGAWTQKWTERREIESSECTRGFRGLTGVGAEDKEERDDHTHD